MIKEKTGKLINDRTQTFGLDFIDLFILTGVWLANSFVLFKGSPMIAVFITGLFYIFLVILRTSKRSGWFKELVFYYVIKEIYGGVYYEKCIYQDTKNKS